MKKIKTLLLVSTFIAGGAIAAFAQSTATPGSSSTGSVSAATHCKDSSGNVKMKSAMSGTSGSSSTGTSASSGSSGSSGSAPAGGASGDAAVTSGSGSGSATTGSGASANLPSC